MTHEVLKVRTTMLVFSIEVPNGKVQSNNSTSHENCFLREQGEERLDSLYERHGRKSVSPFDQWGLTIPAHSLPGAWYFLCISKETSFYTNTSLSNDRVFYILGGVSLLVADGLPPLQLPRACKTITSTLTCTLSTRTYVFVWALPTEARRKLVWRCVSENI